jgi:hypothetical protein
MRPGARTPEELETLLEDAYVLHDREALSRLFDDDAVLEDDGHRAQGGDEIARHATSMWVRERIYVADPRHVVQARDTALVVAEGAISVVRRGSDGAWRYAISLLTSEREEG